MDCGEGNELHINTRRQGELKSGFVDKNVQIHSQGSFDIFTNPIF